MITRILSVTFPALFLAGALGLGGCIENPEDDPEAALPPHSAKVDLPFRHGNLLQLRVEREGTRTRLRAVNTGLHTVDSATFLLQIADPDFPQSKIDYSVPVFEYIGWVENLAPGATREFGVIDTLGIPAPIEYLCSAWLLKVGLAGASVGSSYAGLFSGTYIRWEEGGKVKDGLIRGLIDANASFRFALHPPGSNHPESILRGSLKVDGTVALPFSADRQPGRQGRVTAQDGRFLARFDYVDTLGVLDSLEIRFESALPRAP
jgi:hypothetical protein